MAKLKKKGIPMMWTASLIFTIGSDDNFRNVRPGKKLHHQNTSSAQAANISTRFQEAVYLQGLVDLDLMSQNFIPCSSL